MRVGMYTALSGATARQKQLDDVAHDLSNADTTGYRSKRVPFNEVLVNSLNGNSHVARGAPHINLQEGRLEYTDNPLDIAINGEGFFVVGESDDGQSVALTRDGRLTVDEDGTLLTRSGYALHNLDGGPIQIPPGSAITIDSDGVIWDDEGMIDHIAIMRTTNPDNLRSIGGSMLETNRDDLEINYGANVVQGALEGSNVDAVKTMTEMISLHRHFDTMQQLLQTHRAIDGKAIESVGRSRG